MLNIRRENAEYITKTEIEIFNALSLAVKRNAKLFMLVAKMKDIINKFDREHGRIVSYKWYNPEFPKEDLVRKVRSGEIFI